MKKILTGIALLLSLASSFASAETYHYTGQPFTQVVGGYTTAMRVTGTIVTNTPITPDSVDLDIRSILTSWSFSDGMQTINHLNGTFHPGDANYFPLVSTDADGNINAHSIHVFLTPIKTTLGAADSIILTVSTRDQGLVDVPCTGLSATDICIEWVAAADDYGLNFSSPGSWVTGLTQAPVPIPSLSAWSLMLMTLLLGLAGFVGVKRKNQFRGKK